MTAGLNIIAAFYYRNSKTTTTQYLTIHCHFYNRMNGNKF